MLSVIAICCEYAATRPASNAIFLSLFSIKAYPWVWLATVPLNFGVIYLYNRFLPHIGPLRMLVAIGCVTIGVNMATSFAPSPLSFVQYAWKDIYIILMLKQVWSMIHTTIPVERSKTLYGCIYGMGTLGAIGGSLIPAHLATWIGAENILMLSAPLYLSIMGFYYLALQRSNVATGDFSSDLTQDVRPQEALFLIRRTPVLMAILTLVVCMQVSVGLMEYRFNAFLEMKILSKDLRAAYCGQMTTWINLLSLACQFIGSFILFRFVGLKKTHVLIPLLLTSSFAFSMFVPTFAILSFSYVFLKAIDFSIFGVAREMLYTTLPADAKFRSKAVIDVFVYRTSKALISLGLLFFQWLAVVDLIQLSAVLSMIVFLCWLGALGLFFRRSFAL
jgi:AAA family ATP:ADP antiporter